MLAAPILAWLLIAAGFAPSVFGQGYPVERMRFLARFLMIVVCVLEGIWLGMWSPVPALDRQWGVKASILGLLVVSILYPLRTSFSLLRSNLPDYRERVMLWDLRNEYILSKTQQGVTDLVVPGISGFHGVKEVDGNPEHWINLCAAEFYGASSIEAVSVDDQDFMEMLTK
jgi:hypothetical protein